MFLVKGKQRNEWTFFETSKTKKFRKFYESSAKIYTLLSKFPRFIVNVRESGIIATRDARAEVVAFTTPWWGEQRIPKFISESGKPWERCGPLEISTQNEL